MGIYILNILNTETDIKKKVHWTTALMCHQPTRERDDTFKPKTY